MGWYYKPPSLFPASYLAAMREAAAIPDQPVIFHSAVRRAELDAISERFRWLKWCIRKEPNAVSELYQLLSTYDYRFKTVKDEVGWLLYLTAKPTKLSEFIRLNPELSAEVLPQCQ